MNPLEILRYVAGLDDRSPEVVALSALDSLGALADRPEMLLVAIRRLLESHPRNGLLWTLANRILLSIEVGDEVELIRDEILGDQSISGLFGQIDNGMALYFLDMNRAFETMTTGRTKENGRSVRSVSSKNIDTLDTRDKINYFDPMNSISQLIGKAHPPNRSALVLEPSSFSGGRVVIASHIISIANQVLGDGVRVIIRIPFGFELPSELFDAQIRALALGSSEGGSELHKEVTTLSELPGFRANPESVTYVMGSRRSTRNDAVASELI
ncbi:MULTISPECIES: hypothetical protein [Acidithrix]|uniref:Uncharacterized protein n=1 Tax=Acidithrix ferrooxidans TaxID=1280514 RepID=A0A0D8HIJ6_9ACTN|nr:MULTISPECIES: hypothetical protein [Acidithrix]KJF17684.1 hypothetical protein AXFE_13920 [Acidithrix ferrooxidans]CAG4924591.1 unnamed protein product [Acidithrix sp. C25]